MPPVQLESATQEYSHIMMRRNYEALEDCPVVTYHRMLAAFCSLDEMIDATWM
jgi:hypothetical protein